MARLAFVTGATGFIGGFLVKQLTSGGWRVRALVRPSSDIRLLLRDGVELHRADLDDADSLVAGIDSSDVVFHLAAVTAARSEAEYERVNAEGTRSVVRAIAAAGRRPRSLVYLSSYAASGPAVDGVPRTSADEPAPLTAYGRTKLAGEHFAKEAESLGLDVSVIRAPVVYGPRDRALLPYFRLLRYGIAPVPGGQDRKLHLVYAPDLAIALANAVSAPPGTYAIAEPPPHSWDDIIDAIARGMRRQPLRFRVPAALVRLAAGVSEVVGRATGSAVAFNREKAEEMLASDWVHDLSGSDLLLPKGSVTPLGRGMELTTRWYIRQGWL